MAQPVATRGLRFTPLHDVHIALGAKMVPFAGYEMPVHYLTGIAAEHAAVRQRCGLFDVSHMGELEVQGPGAVDFVNVVTSNNVAALAIGQCQYSTILNDRGTIEDDCLVYRFADRIMIVVNASNREKVVQHIRPYVDRFDCTLTDVSDDVALLALQGPEAPRILQPLTDADLSAITYYRFAEAELAGVPATISRTGYTGEDGFELYVEPGHALRLWQALTTEGSATPAGLGARDTLRLEMGFALYGNDIDDTVTPLEAGLGWIVRLQKEAFVGRDALLVQKEHGIPRKLVGFTTTERSFPRPGYPVVYNGAVVGHVRSGTMSPTLGIPIGTCYLPTSAAREGERFEIEIRGKRLAATVVKMPFYKRAS